MELVAVIEFRSESDADPIQCPAERLERTGRLAGRTASYLMTAATGSQKSLLSPVCVVTRRLGARAQIYRIQAAANVYIFSVAGLLGAMPNDRPGRLQPAP